MLHVKFPKKMTRSTWESKPGYYEFQLDVTIEWIGVNSNDIHLSWIFIAISSIGKVPK